MATQDTSEDAFARLGKKIKFKDDYFVGEACNRDLKTALMWAIL